LPLFLFLHGTANGAEGWNGNGGNMTTRNNAPVRKYGNGRVKRLNNEAFKLVEERANEIALALMDATNKGHVMSARLLVELAEGSADPEDALSKNPLRSLALRLSKQPQLPVETLAEPDDEETEDLESFPG
jgi:hypothetical protein